MMVKFFYSTFSTFLLSCVLLFFWGDTALAAGIRRFGEDLCQKDGYTCHTVSDGETWESLWPDARERDLVRRVNRMNIRLRAGFVLAVPDLISQMSPADLSPFPLTDASFGEKTVVFSPALLAWAAYDEVGNLVRWGPGSSGKNWCPDNNAPCQTPEGRFNVYVKGKATCRSRTYPKPRGGAPMPYCMFFVGGYAIHGSPELPGYNASHGCVRIYTEDARWLSENFVELPEKETGKEGTPVRILSY